MPLADRERQNTSDVGPQDRAFCPAAPLSHGIPGTVIIRPRMRWSRTRLVPSYPCARAMDSVGRRLRLVRAQVRVAALRTVRAFPDVARTANRFDARASRLVADGGR
jgi:hypothetical protein